MAAMRFIMNAGRTSKQGQQINVGKDNAEYEAIVNTVTMHPDDLKALGVVSGRDHSRSHRVGRNHLPVQGRQSSRRDDFRALWAADLPSDGRQHRRDGDADLQGLGSGRRAGRLAGDP